MNIYEQLAQKIRLERVRAGLSLEQLAGSAGISPSFLAYIESGKRKPSLTTVSRLSESLGLSMSELFESKRGSKSDHADHRYLRQFAALLRKMPRREKEALLATVKAVSKSLRRR